MTRSHLVLTAGIALFILAAQLAGAATIAVENLSSVTIPGTDVAPSCSYDVVGTVLGSVDPGQTISTTASFGVAPDDCVSALQDDSGFFEGPVCSASTAHLSSPSAPDLVLVTYTQDYSGGLACAISFALSAPTQLSATPVGTARIVLSWGSSEVPGFNIYRKSGVGTSFAKVGSTGPGVVIFNDLNLAPSTTYTYQVTTAIGSVESEPSAEASATTFNTSGAPFAPSELRAVNASDNSGPHVGLSWFDNSSDETSFHVERKQGSGSYGEIVVLGPDTSSYTDSTIGFSHTYTYRVRACNSSGCSAYSNESVVTM